jgi:hypothetical protein
LPAVVEIVGRGRSASSLRCNTDWRSTGESYGKVGVYARLLDGYAERDGRSFVDGREVEVRFLENAGE